MLKSIAAHRWIWAALLGIALVALVIRIMWATTRPALDDAYITFRYVRNLTRGWGFVYNPGEQVLGTTTPLFTLLLTPLGLLGADIISSAKWINVLASTADVILVFLIARRHMGDGIALLGAMLLAITPSAVWATSTGMETEFNVLLLLSTAYAFVAERYTLTAVLAAIAVMTRPDDLILVVVIFGWQTLNGFRDKQALRQAIKMVSLFVICLLPWAVFSTAYFGSPIPNSILGKVASSRIWVGDNIQLFIQQFGFSFDTPRALAATALFLLGLIYLVRARDRFLIFPIFFALYSAAFVLLGVRLGAGWYWQPLWPAYCIIFAGGIAWLSEIIQPHTNVEFLKRYRTAALAGLALVIVLIWFGSLKARFIDNPPPTDNTVPSLEAAGKWLYLNTPANAKIGLEPIGAVGWFSDRFIVDFVALVSPAAIKINERLGAVDFFGNLSTFQPDYYLAWADRGVEIMTTTPDQKDWFFRHYKEIRQFGGGENSAFILFQKVTD